MPQATIKLQQAPAPAASVRKPAAPAAGSEPKAGAPDKPSVKAEKAAGPVPSGESEETDSGDSVSEIPLPLLIAAAVLALAALGIQVWTFIS